MATKAASKRDAKASRPPRADGKRRRSAFRVGLLSGMSASAAVQCCMFPLNTIKTRLQARPAGAGSVLAQRRTIFRGLYRGFFVDTFGSIPGTGVFMATYEVLKASGAVAPGVAAPCAAFAGSLLTAPCDAIKQRMQVNPARTVRGELTAALRSPSPIKALFVGYPQFLMRDLPFDTIQIIAFETLKRWHSRTVEPGRRRTSRELAALGGAAGALTGLVTTPLDMARTAEVCAINTGLKCRGITCLVELVKRGGPRVLLRGAVPRMAEISLGGVLYFSALERTKRMLGWEDEGVVIEA